MLVLPDYEQLRKWLTEVNKPFFLCEDCPALHLYLEEFIDGLCDCNLNIVDSSLVYSYILELRQSAVLPLSADLNVINASTLYSKLFIEMLDSTLPKLIICHTLPIGAGITKEQFAWFLEESHKEAVSLIGELKDNQLLLCSDIMDELLIDERNENPIIH